MIPVPKVLEDLSETWKSLGMHVDVTDTHIRELAETMSSNGIGAMSLAYWLLNVCDSDVAPGMLLRQWNRITSKTYVDPFLEWWQGLPKYVANIHVGNRRWLQGRVGIGFDLYQELRDGSNCLCAPIRVDEALRLKTENPETETKKLDEVLELFTPQAEFEVAGIPQWLDTCKYLARHLRGES